MGHRKQQKTSDCKTHVKCGKCLYALFFSASLVNALCPDACENVTGAYYKTVIILSIAKNTIWVSFISTWHAQAHTPAIVTLMFLFFFIYFLF